MRKYISTILFSLVSVGTAMAASVDSEARPRIAFIVEAFPRDPADSLGELDRYIGRAVSHYADFWLAQRGYVFDVNVVNHTLDLTQIARLIADSQYTQVIYSTPHGRIAQREIQSSGSVTPTVVDGFLNLDIQGRIYSARRGAILSVRDKRVASAAKEKWLWTGDAEVSNRQDSLLSETPEPFEFVIQRAVTLLLDDFRAQPPPPEKEGPSVEATVYVDSSMIYRQGPTWTRNVLDVAQFASRSLRRQFGASLSTPQIITSFLSSDSSVWLMQSLDALKRNTSLSDTLTILMSEQRTPLDYFTGQRADDLGITDLGGSRIAIDCMPAPHPEQADWFPYMNGLILLHEIGHTFGAIHVFDRESIMAHRLTWMGSDMFDSLNVRVVREVLSTKVDATRPVEYVALVSRALRESKYPFADFPDFFWRYLGLAKSDAEIDSLTKAIDYEPYVISAHGMSLLNSGDKAGARLEWDRALKLTPNQPVLFYYLALSSSGADSVEAITRALQLGLYLPSVSNQNAAAPHSR
jgi:hypothetical protein